MQSCGLRGLEYNAFAFGACKGNIAKLRLWPIGWVPDANDPTYGFVVFGNDGPIAFILQMPMPNCAGNR